MTSCGCKRAVHVHGDINTYIQHKCRCGPCRAAKAREHQLATLRKKKIEHVDVELARARIRQLQKAGLTIQVIARLTGIHPQSLYEVLTKRSRERTKTTRKVYDALMAVDYKKVASYQPLPNATVDATLAREQVQALHCLGWCPESLADRSGIRIPAFYRLLQGYNLREHMRANIEALYLELRATPAPEDTEIDRKRSDRSRTRAQLNGWTADIAEDWFDARAA